MKKLELTDNPRLAAFQVLEETAGGLIPEEALERRSRLLERRDKGLTTALVYECLRHQSYLDAVIESRLDHPRQARAEVRLVLRLGLAQMVFFSRLGQHAVISETVNLAKAAAPGRHGLVNAVLRGLTRDRETGRIPWPPQAPPTGDPPRDLAVKYSFPLWLVKRFLNEMGAEETEELLLAMNRPTPPTLRLNPLKTERESLAALLPFEASPTPLSPWGLALNGFFGQPADWPGFSDGLFAVQDEASQLAGLLADSATDMTILDACAGLGSKGLHLATLNPKASVLSMDKDPKKLAELRREAGRLGCEANMKTEPQDLLKFSPAANSYDLVLLDAPCSGLGAIRRRPDLKWKKEGADLRRLADLQLELLLRLADAVRPGGRLIFGLCSFSREEGPDNAGGLAPPPPPPPRGRPHPDSLAPQTPHRRLFLGCI